MTCNTTYSLRNLLLNSTVRNECIGLVSHPLSEASHHKSLGDSSTYGHCVALTQWARCVLYTVHKINLWVTRGDTSPLAEVLQILHLVESRQHQNRIKHRRHVARVEEEAITERIGWILRVKMNELRVEQIDKICTAHSSSGVTRLSLFYHSSSQYANIIGSLVEF